MDYFYKFCADGSCDIICTRCFLKIGSGPEARTAREQADLHICRAPRETVAGNEGNLPGYLVTEATRERILRWVDGVEISKLPVPVLLLLAIVVFYILPNFLEFAILRHASPWAAKILIGDLAGCIGIFVALKKKKLAVILYLALTAVECWLFSAQIISAHSLFYLTDLVPTAVMASAILRPSSRLRLLRP